MLLITWRERVEPAVIGLDDSWTAALHHSVHLGIVDRLAFTYGPLGFLTRPFLYHPSTWGLALAYVSALRVSTAWLALRISSAHSGRISSYFLAAAATLTGVAIWPGELPILVVFLWLLYVNEHREELDRLWLPCVAAGVGTALHLLIKFSTGFVLVTMFLLAFAAWDHPKRRLALSSFGAGLIAGLSPALGLGGLSYVLRFFHASVELAAGYSRSMGVRAPGRSWEIPAALIVAAALIALVWLSTESMERDRRRSVLVAATILILGLFKWGFVRHGSHAAYYFVALTAVALSLPWRRSRRTLVLGTCVVSVMVIQAASVGRMVVIGPTHALRNVASQLAAVISYDARERVIDDARSQARAEYALSPRLLAHLGGSVHIDPWETGVAWAYPELRWVPLPVFQSYAATTRWLDDLNADTLVSPQGPTTLLRGRPRAISSRSPYLEAPQTAFAALCSYREAERSERWQVLIRSRGRCDRPRMLRQARVGLGESIVTPKPADPNAIIVAYAQIEPSPFETVANVLYKPAETYIDAYGGRSRFVTGTEGPLPIYVPSTVNFTGAWRIPRIRSLRFTQQGWPRAQSVQLTFYQVGVHP